MESIINDSSLDDVMDAGIRAEISSNGKSIDLNTFRPWKKWVNRFRSSKELDRGWTASKILTTISLFVPLTVFLPAGISTWTTLVFSLAGIIALGISIGCNRFLNKICDFDVKPKGKHRSIIRHLIKRKTNDVTTLIMHDEMSLQNWFYMGTTSAFGVVISTVFTLINGDFSTMSWLLTGGVLVVGVLTVLISRSIGGVYGRDLLSSIEEKMNRVDREEAVIEDGDPSNALDPYVADGDREALRVVNRYKEMEERLTSYGQDLGVCRSKYMLAFQSLRRLFDLRGQIKEDPEDYNMDLSQINELLETSTHSMMRSLNADIKGTTDQYADSIRIEANYVNSLDDDLPGGAPSASN